MHRRLEITRIRFDQLLTVLLRDPFYGEVHLAKALAERINQVFGEGAEPSLTEWSHVPYDWELNHINGIFWDTEGVHPLCRLIASWCANGLVQPEDRILDLQRGRFDIFRWDFEVELGDLKDFLRQHRYRLPAEIFPDDPDNTVKSGERDQNESDQAFEIAIKLEELQEMIEREKRHISCLQPHDPEYGNKRRASEGDIAHWEEEAKDLIAYFSAHSEPRPESIGSMVGQEGIAIPMGSLTGQSKKEEEQEFTSLDIKLKEAAAALGRKGAEKKFLPKESLYREALEVAIQKYLEGDQRLHNKMVTFLRKEYSPDGVVHPFEELSHFSLCKKLSEKLRKMGKGNFVLGGTKPIG